MYLFRNPEVRKTAFLYILVTAAAAAGAGFFISAECGLYVLCSCLLLCLISYGLLRHRYNRIARLVADIDKILYQNSPPGFDSYSEGELAILQSEIYKMAVKLREQAQNLSGEKILLADALADISHQLRTPLTALNLIVSLLSHGDLSDERREQLTLDMKSQLGRIDWLINSLLKASRLDAGTIVFKNEAFSVSSLLSAALEPLEIALDLKDISLSIDSDGNEHITGDALWIAEAVTNTLKNAMEHTPSGGKIQISATETSLFTEIIISDNGGGIPEQDLPHLFERFYKGRNSASGSIGIGLNLTKMIVAAQNGSIKAENSAYGGARFTIRFYKSVL